MPELRPTERYMAEMTRLERRVVRESSRVWLESRTALIEAIVTTERAPALLPAAIGQVLDSAARQITQVLAPVGAEIAASVARLVEAQTGTASPLPPDAIRLDARPWQANVQGQMLAEVNRLQASGANTAEILARLVAGDASRVSLWIVGGNALQLNTELALWSAANGLIGWLGAAAKVQLGIRYQKQAIAVIDERTTDCCLRVHGQVQPLDQPFHLAGTPRFAGRVMNPPFHWRCRTATTLYLPEMEARGIPTTAMRDAARDEIEARKRTGKRQVIRPASATSRR